LRSAEAYRPDIILLAENIVGQEAAATVLRLRARNCSVAIIFLLEERDAITAADLRDLDVEGILLSAACARSVIDCVESVRHGRLRNKEIARELHLCEGTVKMHLHHIYEKLRLRGRTQLALSFAGACAPMPLSGDEVCPPAEPARPNSPAAATFVAWAQRKNLA
jgi:two-component system, NarL family, nitrate/nitrite response regulator NarL